MLLKRIAGRQDQGPQVPHPQALIPQVVAATDAAPSDSPQIWVDADACPGPVKDILFRAAERAQVCVTLVANQWLRTTGSRFVRAVQVVGGFDEADDAIVERCQAGDLVVTQDIPLAARVLEKGAVAVNPRGEPFTQDNIAQRLSMRNFTATTTRD